MPICSMAGLPLCALSAFDKCGAQARRLSRHVFMDADYEVSDRVPGSDDVGSRCVIGVLAESPRPESVSHDSAAPNSRALGPKPRIETDKSSVRSQTHRSGRGDSMPTAASTR